MMRMPKVTVVISTYNRPDVLYTAIKSVELQTFSNLEILVVGDNCDQETEKTVTSFDESRIKYINLPFRVGDQSGPNSVGIALAKTEYLAFMNQDDIWIEDHLEYALETIEETKSDFFIGRCAFAHNSEITSNNLMKPIFNQVNPDNRTADMSFDKVVRLFESASSWVIKTSQAKRIGYWKPARNQHRNPMQNWATRAWRKKTKFVFGEAITVLKMNTHHKVPVKYKKNEYSVKSLEHQYMLILLENQNSYSIRNFVEKSLEHHKIPFPIEITLDKNKKFQNILWKTLVNGFTKSLFKYTGIDGYEIYFHLLHEEKGHLMEYASMKRTGKPLPEKVDLNSIIDKIIEEKIY